MIYGIYALRDDKTGWLTPHVDVNDGSAIRNFKQAISNKDSTMNFAPGDFGLYKLGEYDSEKGTIIAGTGVPCLLRGDDV